MRKLKATAPYLDFISEVKVMKSTRRETYTERDLKRDNGTSALSPTRRSQKTNAIVVTPEMTKHFVHRIEISMCPY